MASRKLAGATGSARTGRSGPDEVERALFAPQPVGDQGGPVSFAEVTAVHAAYHDARYVQVLAALPRWRTGWPRSVTLGCGR